MILTEQHNGAEIYYSIPFPFNDVSVSCDFMQCSISPGDREIVSPADLIPFRGTGGRGRLSAGSNSAPPGDAAPNRISPRVLTEGHA